MILAAILATAACHVGGHAPYVTPDNTCTPGSYTRLTRQQACTPKTRPTLPAADRRWIVTRYGVPNWTGKDGELDHRVPFFLGGNTNRRNIWPEVGSIPNTKDRLEFYVHRRVCDRKPYPMRVTTAVRLFLADWVHAYRVYLP